jgi:hypothetical protein
MQDVYYFKLPQYFDRLPPLKKLINKENLSQKSDLIKTRVSNFYNSSLELCSSDVQIGPFQIFSLIFNGKLDRKIINPLI